MKQQKNRLLWVDIYKGILIVLMVLGHTKSPLLKYIYAFHMAAFFFISGYTTDYDRYNLFEYIKRKFKTLVIPFFSVNTAFFIGLIILEKIGYYDIFFSYPVSFNSIKELYLYFWTSPLGGATWFLMVLFLSSIACKFMNEIIGEKYKQYKEYIKVLISFGLSILSYLLLFYCNISLPYYLDMVPLAMLFISLGNLASAKYKGIKTIYKYLISITTILVYFWYTIFDYSHVEWVSKTFPNLFILIMISIGGILLLYYLSMITIKINNKYLIKTFNYLGQNTIAIVLYHFLAFKIIYIFLYLLNIVPLKQLSKDCLIEKTIVLSTVTTIVAIVLSIIINKMVNKVVQIVKSIDYKKLLSKKSLVFIGLFILTFFFNRWTFKSDFVFDDWNNLVTLPYQHFNEIFSILPNNVYCSRPGGWVVVKLILIIFKLNYAGHAFSMMFIHCINGVLLYLVANKMLNKNKDKYLISLIASLIFLLYPISTFASIWEAGMFDLFGCTLTLLCMLIYLNIRKKENGPKKSLLIILMIIIYYISLRTKEMFILLPLVLVCYELFDSIKIKTNMRDTFKSINIKKIIKNNKYLIVMCILMLSYFILSRYLSTSSTSTDDITDIYYYTFNPIVLLINLFKYICVYFSKNSLVYGDVVNIIKYDNYYKMTVLLGCLITIIYSISKLIKNEKLPIIFIIGFVFIIAPVLPMRNMHHVLYLYCPSVFLSLLIAYISVNIFKYIKNYEIKLIILVLTILTCVNLSGSVKFFRNWWIETAKTDSDTYDYFVKIKKKYPNKKKIYVINVPTGDYTSFYNGNGYIVKVAFDNPKLKVYINNDKYDIDNDETLVIDFNDYDFIILK